MQVNPRNERWSHLSSEQQALVQKLLDERLQGNENGSAISSETPNIEPVARTETLPLSFAQQRLWFFEQLVPGSPAYNIPVTLSLRGLLDADALVSALKQVVRRHEILRAAFHSRDGQPIMTIDQTCELEVPILELTPTSGSEWEHELQRVVLTEARQGFNLSRPPLMRATIIRRGVDDHLLLLNVHHMVCDGHSLTLLLQDVQKLYEAAVKGVSVSLKELPIQYVDFAFWQTQTRQIQAHSDLEYWEKVLRDAPTMIPFAGDQSWSRVLTFKGKTRSLSLPPALSKALRVWSESANISLFVTMFAAFELLLQKLTGQKDMVIGALIDGRPLPDGEDLIGLFVNPLPIRTTTTDDPIFALFAQRIQNTLWEAIEHQSVSFEQIVSNVVSPQHHTPYPLFNVMVIQEVMVQPVFYALQTEVRYWDNENGTAKYDLSLSMVENNEELRLNIAYNPSLLDDERVNQMVERLQLLLSQVVAAPESKLSEFVVAPIHTQHLPSPAVPSEGVVTSEQEDEVATPSPEVAASIQEIWSEVLGVEHVELDSNFFELGGHSLLALQVMTRVLERFQEALPSDTFEFEGLLLNRLFEEPTVRVMALMVEEALLAELAQMSDEEAQQLLDAMGNEQ
jgi:acyl carrier protein